MLLGTSNMTIEGVPGAGLEPALPEEKGILNPPRLPIPPPGQIKLFNSSVVNRSGMKERKTLL